MVIEGIEHNKSDDNKKRHKQPCGVVGRVTTLWKVLHNVRFRTQNKNLTYNYSHVNMELEQTVLATFSSPSQHLRGCIRHD